MCCQNFKISLTDGEENKETIDLFRELLIVREMVDGNIKVLQTLLVQKARNFFLKIYILQYFLTVV